jgi:hypothetical protein
MRMIGPEVYKLSSISANGFSVTCPKGTNRFSGDAASKKLKLYVAVGGGEPVYVGITKQPIQRRLYLGWKAKGANGYHGYAWRHHLQNVDLMLWYHDAAVTALDIETVEAEVAFLIRKAGQWPRFQTEIHFHPSLPLHRQTAELIYANILAHIGH